MKRLVRVVRWLVVSEIGVWRSLFLWITRRVPGMGPRAQAFSYSRQIAPILWAFIFVSLIELPVVHLLIPWDGVRLVVLIVSVWGLLWMVGMLASMKVFLHLLDEHGLRIRYGWGVDIRVPREAIETVRAKRGSARTKQTVGVEGTVADVAVMNQTRVEVVLREPTTIALPDGPRELTALHFYADDARAVVEAARADGLVT
ncbi:MAG TPA: hypothetical protein VNO82_11245 [Solirubrobacteraceae bacterium]|nr:hypothetical protein [Solirubrobacteraceae bacterium]